MVLPTHRQCATTQPCPIRPTNRLTRSNLPGSDSDFGSGRLMPVRYRRIDQAPDLTETHTRAHAYVHTYISLSRHAHGRQPSTLYPPSYPCPQIRATALERPSGSSGARVWSEASSHQIVHNFSSGPIRVSSAVTLPTDVVLYAWDVTVAQHRPSWTEEYSERGDSGCRFAAPEPTSRGVSAGNRSYGMIDLRWPFAR